MADETRRGRGIDDGFYLDTPAVHDDLGIPTPAIHDEIGVPVMADETHDTPPMTDERLAEIRQAHAETRAEMDAWYTAHPNPQWRREHPFDADSVVANTHVYITIPALLAEVERLRAREAATREVIQMLSACQAVHHPTFTVGGIDGVLLFHPTRNVLWMREQARKLVGDELNDV